MSAILEFINVFNSPSNKLLFTEVACYWFAIILHQRFPESDIVYDPHQVHFATRIKGEVYDITGVVPDDSDYILWDEYSTYGYDVDIIRECCIDLKGGESK